MKTIAHIFFALTVFVAAGCYLDTTEPAADVATESAALEVTNSDSAEGLMSVSEAAEGEFGTEDICPTDGQSCSNISDCLGLEQCIAGRCRCECNFGAFCTSSSQCGFAGFCQFNRCSCF